MYLQERCSPFYFLSKPLIFLGSCSTFYTAVKMTKLSDTLLNIKHFIYFFTLSIASCKT